MGPVQLRVADLDGIVNFYTQGVGLEVLAHDGSSYWLGHGANKVLHIQHAPKLKHASDGEAGLFHTAFLFDTEADLAFAVASVASKYPNSFTGSADHLVSKAFYFDDPEGNGVELYWDRPRSAWRWNGTQVQMDTLPLDPNQFLKSNLVEQIAGKAGIGHVHLSVGAIEPANQFYVQTLGFDLMFNWNSTAMFVAAGGYHHHMAMNIWRSRGAGRRQQALGLGDVSLVLGDEGPFLALKDRLEFQKVAYRDDGEKLQLEDPWGNQVTIRA